MQRIAPMLWYDDDAEEAARFYCSIFKNSKITGKSSYGEGGPGPKGQVMIVTFELDGQEFTALNGGPQFPFTEAISLVVNCKDQREIDHYWEKLTSGGGKPVQCGWLKDKYGVSWQVVPTIISDSTECRTRTPRSGTASWRPCSRWSSPTSRRSRRPRPESSLGPPALSPDPGRGP